VGFPVDLLEELSGFGFYGLFLPCEWMQLCGAFGSYDYMDFHCDVPNVPQHLNVQPLDVSSYDQKFLATRML
jgi:hypothetical protein